MRPEELAAIDLNLLVVLHSLLRTRSLTRTAAQLGVSQPAASRALARLRVAFGDRLLVRGGRGMVPTVRAEELSEPLAEAMAKLGSVLDKPRFDPTVSSRLFRIATTDYGAVAVLPSFMAKFTREAPGAGIEVVSFSRDVFKALSGGEVDLLLYSDAPVPVSLHARELFRETFVSLVRRGHPLLDRPSMEEISLEAFAALPHILVSVFGGPTGPVDQALARHGLRRRVALWVPYFATAAFVAAETDLVVTLPARIAARLAGHAGLARLRTPAIVDPFGYRLLWHERSHRDPGAHWLRALMVESARAGDAIAAG